MKKLFISIFLFISVISSSPGQDVKVTAAFDSSRIYIGDQIKFTITVDHASGLNLTLPLFKDTLCKNIEILSGPVFDTTSQNGRTKIIERYLITSFDSGLYHFPPVFAELKNESGLTRFYSDYTQLEVMRVKIAPADTTAKIYDIIKPYRAHITIGEILPWVLIAVLAAIIGWVLIRFINKYKKSKTDAEPMVNPEPAYIIALRELEKLRDEQLCQKGEIKLYYTKLTEILRQYLENRYIVYSLELTTAETLEALIKSGFKKDKLYNQLKSVLVGADLVKFAKHKPEESENETHFQSSWHFVLATKETDTAVVEKEMTGEDTK